MLETVLDTIASYKENIEALKGKIKKALFYPAMTIAVALLVSAVLLVFVVPQVVEQFDTVGQELPLLTRIVIGISTFLGNWWWVLLLLTAALALPVGLALAWAVAEAVHNNNRSRCLFATHYHELTRLAERLPALSLHHVRAREWKGDLVLLHGCCHNPTGIDPTLDQ